MDDIAILIAANDKSIFHLLNDCMHTIQSVTMNWLLPTACTDNLQKLTEVENKVLSNNQKIEEEMINYSLNLLRRLYKVADEMADNKIQRVYKLNILVWVKNYIMYYKKILICMYCHYSLMNY